MWEKKGKNEKKRKKRDVVVERVYIDLTKQNEETIGNIKELIGKIRLMRRMELKERDGKMEESKERKY